MKCWVINLTKELKNIYTKNYKSLLREIKEHLNKWKEIVSSLIGKVSIQ